VGTVRDMSAVDEAATHPAVEDALRAAGWWPGRRHDTARWEAELLALGYVVTDPGVELLREVGGLKVVGPEGYPGAHYGPGEVWFDPLVGLMLEPEDLAEVEAAFGQQLMCVGQYGPMYMLAVGSEGLMVATDSGTTFVQGATVAEGLVQLITRSAPSVTVEH